MAKINQDRLRIRLEGKFPGNWRFAHSRADQIVDRFADNDGLVDDLRIDDYLRALKSGSLDRVAVASLDGRVFEPHPNHVGEEWFRP